MVKQYHSYVGEWYLPPFWTLGYHHSRWGFKDIIDLKKSADKHFNNNFPLECLWLDIDYLEEKTLFLVDAERFPKD